jgi:hypothetical protein
MSYWSPQVERGVIGISAGATNEAIDASVWVRQNATAVKSLINARPGVIIDQWFGFITATSDIGSSGRRWLYTVERVDLTTNPSNAPNFTTSLDNSVFQGSATRYAYNLYEWDTESSGFLGDGSDPTLLPAGFGYVAVSGILLISTVRTYTRTGAGDATAVSTLNIFERANGIEGSCE